jgi:hypothetical protein
VRFSFKARGSEAERVKSREVTSLNKIALGGIQLCDPFHPFQSTASQKIRPKSTALEPERPERPEQTRADQTAQKQNILLNPSNQKCRNSML